jgi:thioredoxin reductase (NADPH)
VAEEYDIIVIGGGIAGLTAGAAAATSGHKTMILIGAVLGGHLVMIEKIDGVPGHDDGVAGYELCPTVQMRAAEAGASFAMEEAEALAPSGDGWMIKTRAKEYTARAVILAMGTRLRKLGVPGEAAFFGKGVSQCASCDAPLMRGKSVVMVGGGDSACQEALTLLPHVSGLILVTDGDALTAQPAYADPLLSDPRVEIRYQSNIQEIVGEAGVNAVRVRGSDGVTEEIEAHGVFVFVGLDGNGALVAPHIAVDETGRIETDELGRTALPGLLAAGTIRQGTTNRAAASAEDGEIAARTASAYLGDGVWR